MLTAKSNITRDVKRKITSDIIKSPGKENKVD